MQRIMLRRSVEKDKDKIRTGQMVTGTVIKDKVYGRVDRKFRLMYVDGIGFDVTIDIISAAVMTGIINKSGTWYSYGDHKVQGNVALTELVKSDPELQAEILEKVNIEIDKLNHPENYKEATESNEE